MDKFTEFIDSILDHSGVNGADRVNLECEILDHLNLLRQEFLNGGYSEDDAINLAIRTFGDSKKIKNEFQKVMLLHNKLNIFNIITIIIGSIPLIIYAFFKDNGYMQFSFIFGEVIFIIPYFFEFIFYLGFLVICTSVTYAFTHAHYTKLLIRSEIVILISLYFADAIFVILSGDGSFIEHIRRMIMFVLFVINILCTLRVFKVGRSLKIASIPSLIGFIAAALLMFSDQINIMIYHGFNSGLGIESIPIALVRLCLVTFAPYIIFICIEKIARYIKRDKLQNA